MRIISHRLDPDSATFKAAQSAGGKLVNPTQVVIHDTADFRPGQAVSWFCNPECPTSAHVVIERSGAITQLVKFDTVAFHAGKSSWGGRSGCNAFTLGVELVNPGMMERRGDEVMLIYRSKNSEGKTVEKIIQRFPVSECREVHTKEHGRGWCLPYTDAQIEAVTALCKTLVTSYPSISEIVTHWLISPRRKVDTNPTFPLNELRRAVFAVRSPEAASALVDLTPEVVTQPSALKAAYQSRTANALGVFVAAVTGFIKWVWDTVVGLLGIAPDAVKTASEQVTAISQVGKWFKINMATIEITVAVVAIVAAFVLIAKDKQQKAASE